MAIIVSPAAYLAAPDFLASLTGVSAILASNLTTAQVTTLLKSASGRVDSIMCRTYLAREEERYYQGNGKSTLALDQSPLIYLRQISFAQPGLGSLIIPNQSFLIDYATSELTTFTPLFLTGTGYTSVFPLDVRLAVRYAWGYGYAIAPARLYSRSGCT